MHPRSVAVAMGRRAGVTTSLLIPDRVARLPRPIPLAQTDPVVCSWGKIAWSVIRWLFFVVAFCVCAAPRVDAQNGAVRLRIHEIGDAKEGVWMSVENKTPSVHFFFVRM